MLFLEKARIYGVDNVGQSNTTLTRTDDSIGKTYAVGISEITSDFNNCYPWSDMIELMDEHGNEFTKIPKFYSKITKNANGTYKHQLSGVRYSGFDTYFVDGKGNEIDYVYAGCREGSGTAARVYSKSGQTVLTGLTLAQFRAACKANGEGYQQYDFLIDLIIKELFMIEFATTNSQSIMMGYTNDKNTLALVTGRTDTVKTPSGSPINDTDIAPFTSNTDGAHACKYRGIENPFGNVWKFVDGISFDKEKVFICTDPTAYDSGKITAPYYYYGNRPAADGYAKTIIPFEKNPLLQFTSDIYASPSTYYSDYYYVNIENGKILLVGGAWRNGGSAGLWDWDGYDAVGYAWSNVGGRLCYKPL